VTSTRNRLLAQLPRGVQDRLAAHVRRVSLRVGELLFTARTPARAAYFPESGLVSLVTTVGSGEAMDVGLIGRDGVAGAQIVADGIDEMPFDGVVRVPGEAARLEIAPLRAHLISEPVFAQLLSRHTHLTSTACVTSAGCIAFHPAHRRCARWLLEASDLLMSAELPLTHDQLAHMMGVRRESVTVALGSLNSRGLIEHGRAHIVVRDRSGLETAACECYDVIRRERRRFLGD